MVRFNPTLKEKLEENPNLTVMGLWWAQTWRFFVCYAAFWFVIFLLALLFS